MPQQENQQPDEAAEWPVEASEVAGELSARTGWLRVRELEACLGCSRRTIQDLYPRLGSENLARKGRVLYLRASAVITEFYSKRIKATEGETPAGKAAQERLTTIKGDIAALDLAKRRGELVELREVRQCWSTVTGELRALGEKLQRKHGDDAGLMVHECIDRMLVAIDATGGTVDDRSDSGA